MKVMKFGGAILRDKDGFEALLRIVEMHRDERVLLVISAFSTATRDLRRAARAAEKGLEGEAYSILERIIRVHLNFAMALISEGPHRQQLGQVIAKLRDELKQYLRGIFITREATPRTMDLVMSYGERLALEISGAYLNCNNFEHISIDSTDIIESDSNFGQAKPDLDRTRRNIHEKLIPALGNCKLAITQGFVARDTNGEITTMGIESSGLTAMVYAILLQTTELTLWTDVSGIRSADPKLVESTNPIATLSLDEACIAAKSGLKLLIEPMLELMAAYRLILVFRNAFDPGGDKTVVSSEGVSCGRQFVVVKSGLYCVSSKGPIGTTMAGSGLFSCIFSDLNTNLLISEELRDMDFASGNYTLTEDTALIVAVNCPKNRAAATVAALAEAANGLELLYYSYSCAENILTILAHTSKIHKYLEIVAADY